ncbi:MAG: hypothetical protein ABR599_04220 [Gemmatimonadota bacterium]
MVTLAHSSSSSFDGLTGWQDAQAQVLGFLQKHPRQWWAIDRLSRSIELPQGYVTMLLVELWIDGVVAREWAGDQPIFQLQKEH